jgi:hypothetical protein
LKKRTKKLLHLGRASPERLGPGFKSFLLLFFKKEVFLANPPQPVAECPYKEAP